MPTRSDIEFAKTAVAKGFLTQEQARSMLVRLGSAEENRAQMSLEKVLLQEELLTSRQIEQVQAALERRIVYCACGQKTNVYRFEPGQRVLCAKCRGVIEVPGAAARPGHSRKRAAPPGPASGSDARERPGGERSDRLPRPPR